MKVDAPPKTKENRKTIRMKNICYLNKKTFDLRHIGDSKYNLTFEYSTTLDVYCSIYFFVNEITDKYNCTLQFDEKYKRKIMKYLQSQTKNNNDDEKKEEEDEVEEEEEEEEKYDSKRMIKENKRYIGTTYLLTKGYNLTFEQSDKDYVDLDDINYKFYEENPALGYYPIVVEFSLKKPRESLLCIENVKCKNKNNRAQILERMDICDKEKIEKEASDSQRDGIQYVTKTSYYGKLILGSQDLYSTEVISQKTQVKNRAFESQDIYGLDRQTDPYSKEENLCVICMTMPRDTALCPCRHLCMCSSCATQLLKRSNKCPVCRAYVSETIKISRNNS